MQRRATFAARMAAPRGLAINRDHIGRIVAQRFHPSGKAGFEQLRVQRIDDIIECIVRRYPVREGLKTAQKIEQC